MLLGVSVLAFRSTIDVPWPDHLLARAIWLSFPIVDRGVSDNIHSTSLWVAVSKSTWFV